MSGKGGKQPVLTAYPDLLKDSGKGKQPNPLILNWLKDSGKGKQPNPLILNPLKDGGKGKQPNPLILNWLKDGRQGQATESAHPELVEGWR